MSILYKNDQATDKRAREEERDRERERQMFMLNTVTSAWIWPGERKGPLSIGLAVLSFYPFFLPFFLRPRVCLLLDIFQ